MAYSKTNRRGKKRGKSKRRSAPIRKTMRPKEKSGKKIYYVGGYQA